MPQVHNKDIARSVDGFFGKHSRFMHATDSGADTKRRLMVRNSLQNTVLSRVDTCCKT